MKTLIFSFVLFTMSLPGYSQTDSFPHSWKGNWKGELFWYQGAGKEPKKVMMQLRIDKLDSNYTWQLIYGDNGSDVRPYKLLPVDTAKGHWRIDENNGIIIDMYWLAGRLSGAFTVGQATIVTSYRLEEDKLVAEFYNISAKPVSTTGQGTTESPTVNSYGLRSYQRAALHRVN